MSKVLIDTVGFLSLWNARDQWNPTATAVFRKLIADGADFYTTSYILLECGNAASRTPFRKDVVEVREQFLADARLIEPTDADQKSAWSDYAREFAGSAGIVDQISFTVMRRLGIADAFTNDRHFKAAGFNTLF
jgi:predicted nucleic acid-binding protein